MIYSQNQTVKFIGNNNQHDPRRDYINQIGSIVCKFKNKMYSVKFGEYPDYMIINAFETELRPHIEQPKDYNRQEFATERELNQFVSDNDITDYKSQLVDYSWVLWWK